MKIQKAARQEHVFSLVLPSIRMPDIFSQLTNWDIAVDFSSKGVCNDFMKAM